MVELDAFKTELGTYDQPLKEVRDSLDLAAKEQRIEELERKMEEPNFWDDPEKAQKQMKELGTLKDDRDTYNKLKSDKEDIETMIEMGYEENDPALIPEIREMLDEFESEYERIRIKTLLSGEYDKCNAIIKLNAGAGGTEAMDWC